MDGDASVAAYWEQTYGTNVWAPVFVRDGFVDDVSLVSFLDKLICRKIGDFTHDMVKWDFNYKGDFTVESYDLNFVLLNCPLQLPLEGWFPYGLIRGPLVPLRVSFFCLGGNSRENIDL